MSKFTAAQLVELANGIYAGAELEHLTDSGWTVLGTKAETVDALLHSWRIKPTKQEYRIKELEEALGELWFTCGKFWDGDDSIEKLLRQVKTKE